MDLSNRDNAFLIWFGVVAVALIAWRTGRDSLLGIWRTLRGKVLGIIIAFGLYVALVVLLAWRVGIWNPGLLKDTVAWFLLPGILLLFRFSDAYEGRRFYLRALVSVIGLTAIVEFYVTLAAFPLWVEILLLPALVFLGLLSAVAGMKPDTRPAKRFVDVLLGILGLAILIGTAAWLADHWATIDKAQLALSFALPIWLTVAALPFIFLFSLYANYETIFVRVDMAAQDDEQARRRAKLALIASFHLRNRQLHAFAGMAPWELVKAKNWGEARRIIAFHRAEARVEEAKKDLHAKKLIRYAGVEGTDWEGHPLDQREYEETKQALDMLATFHRAQYKDGRYRADIMDAVGNLLGSKALPEPAVQSTVKPNGRAWFAWRRTVAGWCVGVGATKPPPDQWTFEGPEPPTGFPSVDAGWKHGDFDDPELDDES